MLIHAPGTRRALERLAIDLTPQRLWHEDLAQEAFIHLWQVESHSPGRSTCWYLRSCQFHLLNHLRLGRSIDSPKRRNGHAVPIHGENGSDSLADILPDTTTNASVHEVVMARDVLSVLLPRLDALEQRILENLLEGRSVRETARTLGLSHTAVANKRRRIGDCLLALLADPPRGMPPRHAGSGKKSVSTHAPELLPAPGGVICQPATTTFPTA